MKKIILILGLISMGIANAQIAIGKSTVDGDGLLDFASGTNNGIILPIVNTLPITPANGTILMDGNDERVKMYQNNTWVNLTEGGDISSVNVNASEEAGDGVIIGATTSAVDGVLVLESSDKALILPKVASPHLNVKSPHAGMMCYDTVSKSVAFFDGSKWHFWN